MKHIDNKLKPPKAFFDWCLGKIPIYEWSNKSKTIRSSDRKGNVIKKQLRSNSKLTFEQEFYSFAIILVTAKRIEIQSYAYYVDIKDGKEVIDSRLVNFEKFENDKHIKRGYCRWSNSYDDSLTPNYSYMGGAYQGTEFYDNGWQEKIKTVSELKYIDFMDIKIERFWISHWYLQRHKIEFLQKINCTKIAEQALFASRNIDMRTITQRYLLDNKHLLKNNNDPFEVFEFKRRIKERNGKMVDGIEKYMHYHDIKYIPKGIGVIRFQNWVIKNEVRFEYYKDYLGLLKDLNIDPIGERLIIPKNIVEAHDYYVEMLNEQNEKEKREFEENKVKIIRKKAKKIGDVVLNDLIFKLPKTPQDIISEGSALNHCVGTSRYIDRHAKNEITLVFVRDSKKIDEPLYTMEIKDGNIVQLRGFNNKNADKDVRAIAQKYVKDYLVREKANNYKKGGMNDKSRARCKSYENHGESHQAN